MLLLKNYLTLEEVENIKKHSYKTTGYSWLDLRINFWWEMCARKLPYVLVFYLSHLLQIWLLCLERLVSMLG